MIAMATRTLVLGIGNTLLADEGVGIHVLRHSKKKIPDLPGVTYVDGGTLSFSLAGWIENTDNLIVIDAAELKTNPGTIQIFKGVAMDRFIGKPGRSVHEVSLSDVLAITCLTGTLPVHRALIAIQPQTIGWGCDLSRSVEEALPAATQRVVDLIKEWRVEDPDAEPWGAKGREGYCP